MGVAVMKPSNPPHRKKQLFPSARFLIFLCAASTAALLLLCSSSAGLSGELPVDSDTSSGSPVGMMRLADPPLDNSGEQPSMTEVEEAEAESVSQEDNAMEAFGRLRGGASCATVEEMGEAFAAGSGTENLWIRDVFHRHFSLHGAARVRRLPPDQFCQEGFVFGKASEAGFGNEMYKILSAAALSVMLNRSLIIGQSRGFFPFGEFISYTKHSFTLKEVRHLWIKNDCAGKYGRRLLIRVDNFARPAETNILCSDWRIWKQPIIWFKGTTDSMAIQFFLKNINPGMKNAASILFGNTKFLNSRPNVFGELLRLIVTPSPAILEAINWVLKGKDPDIALHMRMLTNRSARALKAALMCVKKAVRNRDHSTVNPRIFLLSDTPSFIKEITPNISEFADVLHFDYKLFETSSSTWRMKKKEQLSDSRIRDWGPAPRWVAIVDFFLASRAKHAVISGAHRRVGTTYAQLIAALAAANRHEEHDKTNSTVAFLSSFQNNLLVDGLARQAGWGHAWNRFAGPLSCRRQPHQCSFTPLLPPAWWDGDWQSPIPRDVRRLQTYGVRLTPAGRIVDGSLEAYCRKREEKVSIIDAFGLCGGTKCN